MNLIKVKGNILDLAEEGLFDVIVHGCNCFNTMGAGLALEIKNRYPNVAAADNETLRGDYLKLGNWTSGTSGWNNTDSNFLIINAYTQYTMSKDNDVFEYTAFQLILQKLLAQYGKRRIGLPYIGMGLAGGNKDIIIPMIEQFAERVAAKGGSVTLVEFKNDTN